MTTPTVQIGIDIGGSDYLPHTYLSITHPDGRTTEYGFAPAITGVAGPGKIDITGPGAGRDVHESNYKTSPLPLSESQYDKVMEKINRSIPNPPNYVVTGRSPLWPDARNCTQWAIDVWNYASLPPIYGVTAGAWNPYGQWMVSQINRAFRAALTRLLTDPLAIDLDGDGIETVGINGAATTILFDHDANGTRTGTGWLKADDGWLVRDLDGNGSIDSGRELFGVDTRITSTDIIAGTVNQTVTHERNAYSGFDALRVLDTGLGGNGSAGNGDGLIDAQDAAFAELRVWRDLNQDGISQPGELLSLAAAGIASISIQSSLSNTDLGNGNAVAATATVTRSSGAPTQVGGVGVGTAGNLELADNPFYRTFTDTIPLTAAAQALPEVGGSGWVRDLREGMSLGSGGALAGAVASAHSQATATIRTLVSRSFGAFPEIARIG